MKKIKFGDAMIVVIFVGVLMFIGLSLPDAIDKQMDYQEEIVKEFLDN